MPASSTSETKVKDPLEGGPLTDIERVGKELNFNLKSGHVLTLHMMLCGELMLFDDVDTDKLAIAELFFPNNKGIALTDFQKSAIPTLYPEICEVPDAPVVNFDYLKGKLGKKRSPVKTVLTDEKVIRGIGNAYADEILYDANICPFSVSNKIPEAKVKTLLKSITSVLKDAERHVLKEDSGDYCW